MLFNSKLFIGHKVSQDNFSEKGEGGREGGERRGREKRGKREGEGRRASV